MNIDMNPLKAVDRKCEVLGRMVGMSPDAITAMRQMAHTRAEYHCGDREALALVDDTVVFWRKIQLQKGLTHG